MIRLANNSQEDIEAFLELNRVCYPDEADAASVTRLLKIVQSGPCWLLDDGGVKACLVSELSEGQPYIWSVATTPSYRGKGAATSLIQVFEKHYAEAGYTRTWLHVRYDNPAQKIYFDQGYRVSSVERNIYGPNIHGLVMRKRLV